MKRIMTIIFAGILAAVSCAALAGCGSKSAGDTTGNSSSVPKTTAPATTSPATTAPAVTQSADSQTSEQQSEQQSSDAEQATQSNGQDDEQSSQSSNSGSNYAGISEQDAVQSAIAQVGEGFRCSNYEQGYYDNEEVWVVYLTNDSGGRDYICYVNANGVITEIDPNSTPLQPGDITPDGNGTIGD